MNLRIIICVVGFLMGGCSLNIPLEDQFSDPDAITDVLSARSLLASAYEEQTGVTNQSNTMLSTPWPHK